VNSSHLGADIDVLFGFDLPRGGDDGCQIVFLDFFHSHLDGFFSLGLEVKKDDNPDQDDHGQDNDQLFSSSKEALFFVHFVSIPFSGSISYYTTSEKAKSLKVMGRVGNME
jgi:hypothetical protein